MGVSPLDMCNHDCELCPKFQIILQMVNHASKYVEVQTICTLQW
jgi:hypothetical protein